MLLLTSISYVLLTLLTLVGLTYADFKPEIKRNEFEYVSNILYFDDSPVLFLRAMHSVYYSEDDGKSWRMVDLKDDNGEDLDVTDIYQVDFDNNLGFICTMSNRQFYTTNKGKDWKYFDLPYSKSYMGTVQVNYANHDLMLFSFTNCEEGDFITICKDHWYYSDDGLKTAPKEMGNDLEFCTFTKTNKHFTAGADSNIMCLQKEYDVFGYAKSSKLVSSEDYFKTIYTSQGSSLDNTFIWDVKVYKSFIVATIQTDRFASSSAFEFFVSKDAVTFKKAYFEDPMKSWMFDVLPSTPNSLHVAVYGTANSQDSNPIADVYQSNSEGIFFEKVFGGVYASTFGESPIQKVQEIDGIWILGHSSGHGKTGMADSKSQISFDDGKTWSDLKVTDDDNCKVENGCSLHLLYLSEKAGNGRFVTGPTPGILVGIGNTGDVLSHDFKKLGTYVSRDAGLTWKKARDTASVFAFGDLGNIIVTIPMSIKYFLYGSKEDFSNEFSYSLDQGKTWTSVDLGMKILPTDLLTTKDGTSQRLVLVGMDGNDNSYSVFSIDFSKAFDKTCGDNDKEEWYARQDPKSNHPICVYGHLEKFIRRKQDAKCFMNQLYTDIEVIEEACECTIDDTECKNGFLKNEDDECKPVFAVLAQEYCKDTTKKVKLTSRQMIPGNPCNMKGFKIPENDVELDCSEAGNIEDDSKIRTSAVPLDESIARYFYLDPADDSLRGIPDETLILVTRNSKNILASYDGGITITTPYGLAEVEGKVAQVFTNHYFSDSLYVITTDGKLYVSNDRAISFEKYDLPTYSLLSRSKLFFNKANSSTFIWYTEEGCQSIFASGCKIKTFLFEQHHI
ncbi:unnamed protein product [Ambrosiozyma monospora]|uniref:Unnamed protein product n=1 Tax=Ambrosiozyma monospora TaxID=43982 RepID=A0A9W7DIG8_AMBMO|nr:unnamed protein product [Ambrosiozyma monospora]